jgi:GNAT superfamily N-acetyltransferase
MTRRSIRRASVDDVELLVGIRNESVAYKVALGDLAWGKGGWTEAVARQRIEFNEWYLIELDETPVGMLSLSWEDQKYWGPQDPDAGYAHGISVRDGFHGVGVGSYAIDWCANQVRANRRNRLRLDCDVKNAKLCAYYESLGFARVATKAISTDYVASLYERFVP